MTAPQNKGAAVQEKTIGVVGMGYVGLTLTAALARAGHTVIGVDSQPRVLSELSRGRPHIYEPGVEDVFAELSGVRIHVDSRLPNAGLDAAVICVSTPVDEITREPDLGNLASAARDIADWCDPGTLVVVRSTVPIGASRRVVLPPLIEAWERALLVMAPERTIQGQALRELVELPQVVGGLDVPSLSAGVEVFARLARQVVPVSGLEVAEMVKLVNNCHTDLIYAYGNQVALIAEEHGLDPLEVIRAANVDYPRPDLSRPGYVGGGCLSKDPYLLMNSTSDHDPALVRRARELNEYLPIHTARAVVDMLRHERGSTEGARLAVLGWAYKGWPPTDDMRGTPIASMMPIFNEAGLTVLGHDPMVTPEVIRQYGGEPVSLDKAFSDSDAVLIITDHPDYRAVRPDAMFSDRRPVLIYDSWRILDQSAVTAAGVRYAGLGYKGLASKGLGYKGLDGNGLDNTGLDAGVGVSA
jgi:UDP-N-acetyl-D-mannosaminuronic acid dehydrogenase